VLAPQSDDEVRPIELALRRELDDRLRIQWDPRALITRPGYIDATGQVVGPEHDGRWKVVIVLGTGEPDHCIYVVRWDGEGNEAYRPVGPWLLDFMHLWDRQNVHAAEELRRMLHEEERLEQRAANDREAEDREFWGRVGFELGGEELIGRGFSPVAPDPVTPDTPSGDLTPADASASAVS
jgi:hypothetical protein